MLWDIPYRSGDSSFHLRWLADNLVVTLTQTINVENGVPVFVIFYSYAYSMHVSHRVL
jgi:hypothetical protein